MKRITVKTLVVLGVFSLALNLVVLASKLGLAQTGVVEELEKGDVGRYQIAAWGNGSGITSHYGYFILDTTTGEVVRKREY